MPRLTYAPGRFRLIKQRFSNQFSITSDAGVGGTTLSYHLKTRFEGMPWRFVSGGGLMRSRITPEHPTIEALVAHIREHPEEGHDDWCDQAIAQFGLHNMTVVEGRVSHIFMPFAFKILLVCAVQDCAHRRSLDQKKPFSQTLQSMLTRNINDRTRFGEKYPGCHWPPHAFDLVVDTGIHRPDQTRDKVLAAHAAWLKRIRPADLVTNISIGQP